MPQEIVIWVEGGTDKRFLEDLIGTWYGDNVLHEFVSIETLGNVDLVRYQKQFESKLQTVFQNYAGQGKKNLIIVDADSNFSLRYQEICQAVNPAFTSQGDIFLWPNNVNNGEIEDLFLGIAKKPEILSCSKAYAECLEKISPRLPYIFNLKDAIYSYAKVLGEEPNETKRRYLNDHWDLNPNRPELINLKAFFDKHLL